MRRKTARPYGQSVNRIRLMSMMMAMVVLWMLYNRLKDPVTWRAIADDKEVRAAVPPENVKPAAPEKLVPGPNDQDPDELASIEDQFELIVDRAPLREREMDAYWRLMDWSLTQPFDELGKRAKDDVPFTKLWEQPERYRGKLIRLRLHVRRVVEHDDAPKNPSDVANVYEAWGWTDESRSFPYVVVFPELPEGLPIGTDIRADIVFVGYFLKIMTYKAFDNTRGAPLLVGRVMLASQPVALAPAKSDPWIIPLVLIGGTIFIGYTVWAGIRSRRKSQVKMLPKELSVVGSSEGGNFDNPFSQNEAIQPSSDQRIPSGIFDFTTQTAASPPSEVKT